MTIEIITLSCAGDCADIEAVAHGGVPPYAFTWEDGSTQPTRRVCLDEDATLRVTTTDTKVDSDEFDYEPQTAHAEVTAAVLDCDDPSVDEALLCLANPSFEGEVTPTQFEAFAAPPWNACYDGGFITYAAIADPTLWPAQRWTLPVASDGATYLALGQQLTLAGRAAQQLCAPIAAGSARSFFVNVARGQNGDGIESQEQVIQVLGGNSVECAEEQLLWTSPPLTLEWSTYCVTLRPQAETTTLAFVPFGADGGQMEGLVDHIVPVEACP